jgi:hypothetical protein
LGVLTGAIAPERAPNPGKLVAEAAARVRLTPAAKDAALVRPAAEGSDIDLPLDTIAARPGHAGKRRK